MIRRRLVLAVTATVALAIALGSWLVVNALEDRLVDNVDEQFTNGSVNVDLRNQLIDRGPRGRFDASLDLVQRVAIVRYDVGGDVVGAVPSGTEDDPDPLPDAGGLDPGDGISTVPSDDGPRYRALALPNRDGGTTAVALSLADVDETVSEARRIQVVVGLLAITVVGVSCWAIIRTAFAPIDGMITTAGRIAAGDLTQRTDVGDQDSEVGRLGTALDTMLDRIENAVRDKTESEARMRRFVADASHDLRTPLTTVRGYAELYRKGATDPESVATGMARIEAEATRMSRLVDDLMTLARLDQGRSPATAPVDLGHIAGQAVDAVRVVDPERTYDLDTQDGAWVSGDADQLRQVLDNLLGNARLHTPSGTTVQVRVEVRDDTVDVDVSDDGPGFSNEDRAHAFDRFWRSTRADQSTVEGSGLGLSIVHSITVAHGGTIELGRATSGGAHFSLRFPRSAEHPGATT